MILLQFSDYEIIVTSSSLLSFYTDDVKNPEENLGYSFRFLTSLGFRFVFNDGKGKNIVVLDLVNIIIIIIFLSVKD